MRHPDGRPVAHPFLLIAKKYDYDYGDVLAIAHHVRFNTILTNDQFERWRPRTIAMNDIINAVELFLNIQNGNIDWLSGKPTLRKDKTDER